MSLETVRSDFDRIARLIAAEPERPDRYEVFLLAQVPSACKTVLEVGCGAGRLARTIASRGVAVTGIDASAEMIHLARRRTGVGATVEFVCDDFAVHPFDAELYDCVISVATLHHLPLAPTVARMKSLVRPGGRLLIHDLRTPAGIRDWLASGVAAVFNGDARWWIQSRLQEKHALHEAWHDHGARERYPTLAEVRDLCASALPGAQIHWHPLWRYTLVWTRRS